MISIDPKFFIVTEGKVKINKDYIRNIETFKILLERRKTCKGDSDGRKKIMNEKEFTYIALMLDYESPYRGLTDKEKHIKSKENSGLPKNWTPDKVVKDAMTTYIEIVETLSPTAGILNSLEKGLMQSKYAVNAYIDQMATAIQANKKLQETLDNDNADQMQIVVSIQNTNQLIQANIKEMISMSIKLPQAIKQIKELKAQVHKEKTGERQMRGGRKKGNREDPRR